MRFEIIQGRWHFGEAASLPIAIDLFFNIRRAEPPQRTRSRIGKEHNYKFNFKNR